MARVTVEDCLPNVENLFQLVLLASARARRLANGAEPTVPVDNDKVTVSAAVRYLPEQSDEKTVLLHTRTPLASLPATVADAAPKHAEQAPEGAEGEHQPGDRDHRR